MGGMSAAALLAKAGLKVLVAEGLPRLGGRCSTVEYKGFKCPTGVIGAEMGGPVEEVFLKTGAEFNVRPAGPPRYLIGGTIHRVPAKGGMKSLLDAAGGETEDIEKVLQAFSRAMGWMEPSAALSLREWLLQFTHDERILGLFQTMVSAAMVVNADELPAREFFRFVKTLGGIRRFGFCPAGSINLPNALLKVIVDLGGEIWTEAPVVRILVEKGVVLGAKVRRKEKELEVRAKIVISNAGPKKTVALAGEENFDTGYLRDLERNLRPAPLFGIQMSADEPLIEQEYLLITGSRRVNALFQPTLLCPELAPPGKHLVIAGAAPASSMPPVQVKRELEICLEDLRSLIQEFDKRTRILLAGSYHGDWPGMHSWPGLDMPQKTSIVNLYNVGDGVKPSGTVALPGAVASALAVAEEVKRRI